MRTVTITLDADIARFIELRAAIDDMRIEDGISFFLTALAKSLMERKAKAAKEG